MNIMFTMLLSLKVFALEWLTWKQDSKEKHSFYQMCHMYKFNPIWSNFQQKMIYMSSIWMKTYVLKGIFNKIWHVEADVIF